MPKFSMTSLSRLRGGAGVPSLVVALAWAAVPAVAFAQEEAQEQTSERPEDIVVTGTLIRGIAPAGANVISVGQAEVEATGAVTTAQLLQTIPQLDNFAQLQIPLPTANLTVNRPSLRGLDNVTAGGTTTLILMDGHRLVGAGVTSTAPDPDVIPPGALERVEVVPDGGSAIYGSDAVGGVINFITRKRFDGLQVDGHYGFADDYYQWDVNGTVGKDWGTGSAYVSYNFVKHDDIFGRDRDFVRAFPDATTGVTSLTCNPGNVQNLTNGAIIGLPGVGPANQCDNSDNSAFYPRERRHTVFASLTQELSDKVDFELKGFYTDRKTTFVQGPVGATRLMDAFNVAGQGAFAYGLNTPTFDPSVFFGPYGFVHNVNFQFGPIDGNVQSHRLKEWGITPTFTISLGSNWQLRLLGTYGESISTTQQLGASADALDNAILAGLFNPYDAASTSPAVLDAIGNFGQYGRADQRYGGFRATLDGDLFQMPGGAAKLAVGGEISQEARDYQTGAIYPGTQNTGFAGATVAGVIQPAYDPLAVIRGRRTTKSVFGELVLPVFGSENATGGLQELTISAAGRYDHFSDRNLGTFNPKFGLTYRPFDWVKFRASWGKSFNAPSLADAPEAAAATLIFVPTFFPAASETIPNGGAFPVPNAGTQVGIIFGNSPNIGPQKATTWTLGLDIEPPFAPGVELGVTYYNIKFRDQIAFLPFFDPMYYRQFASTVTLVQGTANPAATIQPFLDQYVSANYPGATNVYAILDGRKVNIGRFKLEGLDFNIRGRQETGFGSINASVNATYDLTRQSMFGDQPWFDELEQNRSRFRIRTQLGAGFGNFQANVIWSHRAGYKVAPAVGLVPQDRVKSFNLIDLFFKYDVKGENLLSDLSFTLNVNNVFDQDPPEYRGGAQTAPGFQNGNTLGRLVQFGVSKKF